MAILNDLIVKGVSRFIGNIYGNLQGTINGHIVNKDVPSDALFTDNNTTYTLTQDGNDGHKITLTPSTGDPTTITIPDNNTTYSAVTQSANGLMTSADKIKLNGITISNYVAKSDIVVCTEDEYNSLATKTADRYYIIEED